MQIPQTHGIFLPLARFVYLKVRGFLSETPFVVTDVSRSVTGFLNRLLKLNAAVALQ